MDKIISAYNFERRGILNYCFEDGVAYQADMSKSVPYDLAYFNKYRIYEKTPMGRDLNRARVSAAKGWLTKSGILDIGIGCGTFLKYALGEKIDVCGFDINPVAIQWLNRQGLFENPYITSKKINCFTFWDSLEHIPDPGALLKKIPLGAYVLVSMPIFNDLEEISESKHFRPDEHYYYFITTGLLRWLRKYSLKFVRFYNFEEASGREGIKTFLLESVITKENGFRDLAAEYFRSENVKTENLFREALKI